ncbi:MAG: hypothetical protein U5N58_07680 [Actinomycetota bacterium]|nr:hypothetical protein [Actinomycetota bacterium]
MTFSKCKSSIRRTTEYFDRTTIALVGIGALYPKMISTLRKKPAIFLPEDLGGFKTRRGYWRCFFFISSISEGKICDSKLSGRLIAMPAGLLHKVPYSHRGSRG